MRKVLIATTNKNKISRLGNLLADYADIELLSFNDLDLKLAEPEETAATGVGIAAQKALAYAESIEEPYLILTQDDTISFEGVDNADNPGARIKEPVVAEYGEFTDEKAILYYTGLADKYGGSIKMTFNYGHAVAYKTTRGRTCINIFSSSSQLRARLVSTPFRPELASGYFLLSIMQVEVDGEWIYGTNLTEEQSVLADADLKQSITSLLEEVENNEDLD